MNTAFQPYHLRIRKFAIGGIVLGVVVFGVKWIAYQLTGSVALYSDAVESVVNIATAVATFLAVRISTVPPDDNHPFGHQKAEYLSAVLEGALIICAAFLILREAYFGILSPTTLTTPVTGLLINLVAGVLNAGWCFALFHYGRRWDSRALIADGIHLRTDVVTSVGVVIGVALVAVTGWQLLDPIIAALVALNILGSGWKLIRESVGGLMDEAAEEGVLSKILEIIARESGDVLEAHDVRTRQAGRCTFIEFHLAVDALMTVGHSHEICDRLEQAIESEMPGAVVTIHVEPQDDWSHRQQKSDRITH